MRRARAIEGPFALTDLHHGTDRIYCITEQAEALGLHRGMRAADARAMCPGLISQPARPDLDARFLVALRRSALRYCPWVARDGEDGLVLDITGAAHLWGGEATMIADMRARADRARMNLRLGLADTRGAAWALAHYGDLSGEVTSLPVAALRLDPAVVTALKRLGLRRIGDLMTTPRAPLTRRFGPQVLTRLDQALGHVAEAVSPDPEPPHYGARMVFPDPIGLVTDVMAATKRLLDRLCAKLEAHESGARALLLTLQRVDQGQQQVELRLASAMRDPARILPLFERGVGRIDAGFGIDLMRLEAVGVEPLPTTQVGQTVATQPDQLNDLITRIGTRIGLDNIQRFLPADSHIPERSFLIAPAAFSQPQDGWVSPCPRPVRLFRPEAIAAQGRTPPLRFRWRRMTLTTGHATGPERIAPEWWLEDAAWQSGLRDYWRIDTREGRRLWLFHTPQSPGWFVHGEFV